MGLSEREQKLLEELERGLYAEDAEFAQRVSRTGGISVKRMIGGATLAVIGISVLLFAVIIQIAAFGIAGFLLMLAGIIVASSNFKPSSLNNGPVKASKQDLSSKFSGFEERWDRRRGE
jgi:hypothetical protein